MSPSQLKVRRSLHDLVRDYDQGDKEPLRKLMKAWKGIKALPPDDPQSFFVLGGYHGEPFVGSGAHDPAFWGGYCNHGNILFPTWHRGHLLALERALQGIEGCQDVTIPFWDETNLESQQHGIPWVLTREKFEGEPNPLCSFRFPEALADPLANGVDYSKYKGYVTERYPRSGLVGPKDKAETDKHNALYPDPAHNEWLLNLNVTRWLKSNPIADKPRRGVILQKVLESLTAPNYTVFSNTTSSNQWNCDHPFPLLYSLESPHNDMHLAIGGYDLPDAHLSPIPGANGDMGEAETSGFDPIFFFHHCFYDYVFWKWQLRHGATDELDIIPGYPGTNSSDNQGPTPGIAPNTPLDLDTPLRPFHRPDRTWRTSRDYINIEKLGYTYGPGSLDARDLPSQDERTGVPAGRGVHVHGIDRSSIAGSFLISLYAVGENEKHFINTESIFSRWHVAACANCQTHLEAQAHFGPHELLDSNLYPHLRPHVEVRTRAGVLDPTRYRWSLV